MFELYQNVYGSQGSLAEVWIDKDTKLVKKYYKPSGITVRGKITDYNIEEISKLFNNEVYWNTLLKSEYVLEMYEYGELKSEPGFYILQEYAGPDLLHYYNPKFGLSKDIPDPTSQIIKMFKFFKQHNVYKFNNAMSNLVNDRGRIRAFDFKYAANRSTDLRSYEIDSIKKWLGKVDPSLINLLQEYI